jgi:hypothetical protein
MMGPSMRRAMGTWGGTGPGHSPWETTVRQRPGPGAEGRCVATAGDAGDGEKPGRRLSTAEALQRRDGQERGLHPAPAS